jgi:protein-tyrosine phosphatase
LPLRPPSARGARGCAAISEAAGGDPELLGPVLGVQREYLEAAYDEMRQRFGSLEGYFTDGLKIDAATRERLRAANILVGG